MLKLAALILGSVLGGWFARMDGGGKPDTPEWVERLLCISPVVVSCVPFAGWYSLIAAAGVIAIITGHGQYFLARLLKAIKPEFFDFIVRLVFGQDPRTQDKYALYRGERWINAPLTVRNQMALELAAYGSRRLYWRNVFGMFILGTLFGLFATGLALWFHQWQAAILYSLTGLATATAYVVGYEVFGNTESAEKLNGFLRTSLCLSVLIFIFGGNL